jgi:hypothetical protein
MYALEYTVKVYDGSGDYDSVKQSQFYYVNACIVHQYSSVIYTFTVQSCKNVPPGIAISFFNNCGIYLKCVENGRHTTMLE